GGGHALAQLAGGGAVALRLRRGVGNVEGKHRDGGGERQPREDSGTWGHSRDRTATASRQGNDRPQPAQSPLPATAPPPLVARIRSSRTGASMDPILVGKAVTTPDALPDTGGRVFLQPKFGNRHGLVAGATGTGKTVTLMTLAEGFSRIG